jgi:hypothetical protein
MAHRNPRGPGDDPQGLAVLHRNSRELAVTHGSFAVVHRNLLGTCGLLAAAHCATGIRGGYSQRLAVTHWNSRELAGYSRGLTATHWNSRDSRDLRFIGSYV